MPRGTARAAPELELSWSSEEGCPDAAWASARIREHLGRTPMPDAEHGLSARAELARDGNGFRLRLRTAQDAASGDRTLHAATCEELAEAAALVIALAIDSGTVAPKRPPDPPAASVEEPGEAPAASPGRDAERPPGLIPAIATRPPRERLFSLRGSALWDVGYQPEWSIGPAIALGFERQRLRVELSGFWLAPRATERSANGSFVRTSLWALRVGGCGRLTRSEASRPGGVGLWACGALELGRTGGAGRGLPQSEQNYSLWRALGAGALLIVPISRATRLAAELGAAVPLNRTRFVAENPDQTGTTVLYEPAPLSGRATLGFELRF